MRASSAPAARRRASSSATRCTATRRRTARLTKHEIVNCSPFLHRELEIVRPRLVITLGCDAERVMAFFYPRARMSVRPMKTAPRVISGGRFTW
ncbi:uracil-DNA glycosylase family protein [Mycobacterium marseillense]|uniref:uracil-DNA glycosylase family protein n=1 Tax=Mycobacterium marseillense TaxID=701042 RepID=UPI000A0ACD43|nr:uracil-DNA glycosylase family protein [Mycobacterium marseillense]MDM3974521.1 uracil-DNA glycosylase family protein [Mycobacterium marseillense]ORA87129.1 hypothetical protein BST31_21870 [Mycobacterium marseillense]